MKYLTPYIYSNKDGIIRYRRFELGKPVCVGQVWSKNEWVWFCNPVASIAWFKTHLQAMEVLDKYLVENEYYLIAENELQRFEKIMLLI